MDETYATLFSETKEYIEKAIKEYERTNYIPFIKTAISGITEIISIIENDRNSELELQVIEFRKQLEILNLILKNHK